MRSLTTITTLLTLLAATGCIHKERLDTIYLDPDGAAVWSIIEKDLRSDADEPEAATEEERKAIDPVEGSTSPLQEALQALGGSQVTSQLVRHRRPYVIYTEAAFGSLDLLGAGLLRCSGLGGSSTLEVGEEQVTYRMTFYVVPDTEPPEEGQRLLADSTDGMQGIKVVLTRGTFVEARGFTLEEGDSAARLDPDTFDLEALVDGEMMELSLTWNRIQ